MGLQLDLGDRLNWTPRWVKQYVATPSTRPGHFYPIPAEIVPITFQRRILAVATQSKDIRVNPTWYRGAWVTQYIPGQTLPFGGLDYQKAVARLNALSLVIFEDIAPMFQVKVEIPKWIPEIKVQFWEYSGSETDENAALLEKISTDLIRIEHELLY